MRKSKFKEEQIIGIWREAEGDTPVKAVCASTSPRRENTFFLGSELTNGNVRMLLPSRLTLQHSPVARPPLGDLSNEIESTAVNMSAETPFAWLTGSGSTEQSTNHYHECKQAHHRSIGGTGRQVRVKDRRVMYRDCVHPCI